MLIEFSVANFRSFKDTVTLSMVAAKLKARDSQLDEDCVVEIDSKLSLLKSAGIYGPNASGKSNLAAAMAFMKVYVMNSTMGMQTEQPIPVESFRLCDTTIDQPSEFEVVFRLEDHKIYRYGFKATTERVVEEWLYFVPSSREAKLFTRKEDDIEVNSEPNRFREGKGLEHMTRPNALFLSVVNQFNGEVAKKVIKAFLDLNVITAAMDDTPLLQYTVGWLQDEHLKQNVVRFVGALDLGIRDFQIEEQVITSDNIPVGIPTQFREMVLGGTQLDIKTVHRKFGNANHPAGSEEFDLIRNESNGTQKLVALAAPILDSLRSGKVLVVDEIDARLHPLLTRAIIKLFNSRDTNSSGAQLIFITHDTSLLDAALLRRDQYWFTEKDHYEASHLYSLAEFKSDTVRNDSSYDKGYKSGRYGAIPFLGELDEVVCVRHG